MSVPDSVFTSPIRAQSFPETAKRAAAAVGAVLFIASPFAGKAVLRQSQILSAHHSAKPDSIVQQVVPRSILGFRQYDLALPFGQATSFSQSNDAFHLFHLHTTWSAWSYATQCPQSNDFCLFVQALPWLDPVISFSRSPAHLLGSPPTRTSSHITQAQQEIRC